MAPPFIHKPVLLNEVLAALRPHAQGRYADGTVGAGEHAAAILEASAPSGWLDACDRDPQAVRAASARLAPFAGRFQIHHGVFSDLTQWVASETCDGILLDLGVSSPQLDQPQRGFSFLADGPLDMRMDQTQTLTAADLVNSSSAENLAQILFEFGDERHSRRIARAIVNARQSQPFSTTRQLAEFIEKLIPRTGRIHPATRTFQALRMAVNDELQILKQGLPTLWPLLKPGGRLAVITFHSLEDRIVKEFGHQRERNYTFTGPVDRPEWRTPIPPQLKWVSRKAIPPSETELAQNPRARSAQLRVMEKL